MEPLDPAQKKNLINKVVADKVKGRRGRPKGSKNKHGANQEVSLYLLWIQALLKQTLTLMGSSPRPAYFVYDGAFGNYPCARVIAQCGLSLISKLHSNAALYFPYEGDYSGKGAPRKYGEKLDYAKIPSHALKQSSLEEGTRTDIYQMTLRHRHFPELLNVTLLKKTLLSTGKTAHVVLFSSDLQLSGENMLLYYRLRFQIEFTFRDAKQYWGLEDFMNIKQLPVRNAANLALFMVNFSQAVGRKMSSSTPFSVHDLKARFHACFYVKTLLKSHPQFEDPIFIQQLYDTASTIGCIHPLQQAA